MKKIEGPFEVICEQLPVSGGYPVWRWYIVMVENGEQMGAFRGNSYERPFVYSDYNSAHRTRRTLNQQFKANELHISRNDNQVFIFRAW